MFGSVFSYSVLDIRPGFLSLSITGKNSYNLFKNEAGGHRWQRIPPTERKGRRHTSTITVAVLREPEANEIQIDNSKLRITCCRGSGAGGQHRNTCDSAVQIKYEDISIRCENERSQHQNKDLALRILRAKLLEKKESLARSSYNKNRKEQVGSGMRGDKIRTVSVINGNVKDHRSNKSISYEKYEKGYIEEL